jgi:N-methylhydantoinase A
MRYRGQSYEVSVAVSSLRTAQDIAALASRFHEAHRRRYGHKAQSEAVEIVNFQVTAVGEIPTPRLPAAALPHRSAAADPHEVRKVYFGPKAASETPVFRRAALPPGAVIGGPAIIDE